MDQLLSSELLESRESVSQVCDRPCPFCHRKFERPVDLQQHVAGHLEIIALLSLPNLDDANNSSEAGTANSNSANRHLAESRADDFDNTEPLAFPEKDRSDYHPVATETEQERFKTKLRDESISFESMNEINVEARQAYSSELVGRWLHHLPRDSGEDPDTHSSFEQEQTRGDAKQLLVIAEKAQDIAATLDKFLNPVDAQTAEITALMSEWLSTSSALRELDRKMSDFPYHRRYPQISYDLTTVKDSLNFTFRDVQRLFGDLNRPAIIPRAKYTHVWDNLCEFFHTESGTSLKRRLKVYRIILRELTYTLIEG